ncbi:hypothetical protein BDN72DRAFT_900223 [Pluteus cervinus]|uniref:Uncharacterized protein n=1 Tax=Pluteus cervinus TaxID=181527 RepID=A0ACD3AJY8_9AGAR|nr:hypothetical protein BDN72DRAFT_900223 [Pluteus cervinus]
MTHIQSFTSIALRLVEVAQVTPSVTKFLVKTSKAAMASLANWPYIRGLFKTSASIFDPSILIDDEPVEQYWCDWNVALPCYQASRSMVVAMLTQMDSAGTGDSGPGIWQPKALSLPGVNVREDLTHGFSYSKIPQYVNEKGLGGTMFWETKLEQALLSLPVLKTLAVWTKLSITSDTVPLSFLADLELMALVIVSLTASGSACVLPSTIITRLEEAVHSDEFCFAAFRSREHPNRCLPPNSISDDLRLAAKVTNPWPRQLFIYMIKNGKFE